MNEITKNDNAINRILSNIDFARKISHDNQSVRTIIVVSGNELDKKTWQNRLVKTGKYLFNSDGSTSILSLQEKVGNKRKEGNFLGTILAYIKLQEKTELKEKPYKNSVVLVGMLFGRGERMSPFTQIEGDRKPAIIVSSQSTGTGTYLTAIEEALFHFVPVAKYLENRGFCGFLDKWGDETEIASIDLAQKPVSGSEFEDYDVIKCISCVKVTSERAKQKDWVVSDNSGTVIAILSRNDKASLISKLVDLGVKPSKDNEYYAGVSLGPIAVSYKVLDIATEVFDNELYKEGIYIDFDPYFVMALCITRRNLYMWEEAENTDKDLQKLLSKVPDFFSKVQRIKSIFQERYGRKLQFKVLDLGSSIFWADIGQHYAMREKYMSLNDNSIRGRITRKLENINDKKDEKGNIIINSTIDSAVEVSHSVIINSTLTGSGRVEKSVVKDSTLHNPDLDNAFAVLSFRPAGSTCLKKESGLYRAIGDEDLVLEQGMRHGTLITNTDVYNMMVSEETNLRDRERTYNIPVYNNKMSFAEAYDEMFGVSEDDLEERRLKLMEKLENKER